MSSIKVPNVGEIALLESAFASIGTFTYHLFKSSNTPADTDLQNCSDYTECDFDGYASQSVTWNTAITNSDGEAQKTGTAALTWTSTGSVIPNTVYGYYVTDVGGNLLWAEKFDAPVFISNGGDVVGPILPKFVLKSIA